MLDFVEETFHQLPFSMHPSIVFTLLFRPRVQWIAQSVYRHMNLGTEATIYSYGLVVESAKQIDLSWSFVILLKRIDSIWLIKEKNQSL
jgi:hypothetical protein